MGAHQNNLVEIVGGQSKFELMSQLNDIGRHHSQDAQPTFRVQVLHPRLPESSAEYNIELYINGIVAKDGSGNNWIIYGYIAGGYSWLQPGTGNKFEGFYNTRTRKGHLKPRYC